MMRTFTIATLTIAVAALAACGGSTEPHAGAASVVVTPATAALLVGKSQQYTATAVDADGQPIPDATFTWKSSATGIATISTDGAAQGVAPGATNITASWNGVTSDPATLAVSTPSITAIHVTPASATIEVGATQSFTAEAVDADGTPIPGITFTWASSAPNVATVDTDGVATAAAAGSTAITATAGNVTSDTASLAVTPDPKAACAGISDVQTWTASLRFAYAYVASNENYVEASNQQAVVSAALQLLASGPNVAVWQGVATGTASIDDRFTDLTGAQPAVTSLIGSGAPLSEAQGQPASQLTLSLNLADCTYAVSFTPVIDATETDPEAGPLPSSLWTVGWLRSGEHSASGFQQGLVVQTTMPAHSRSWEQQNDGDAYAPGGAIEGAFSMGMVTEGNAGTADVNWTFTPSK